MAHLLFNLHEATGRVSLDTEGAEVANPAAGRELAIRAAREIMAHGVREGELALGSYIEIVDAATGEKAVLSFRDAITITD